ncbi:ankyrin-1-like [Lineus longissimus]|uniref:ankyrin-1-like n=1 Tax=Lineus longissimus TaxID=88925 RepID=UPI002B4E8F97
MTNLFSPDLQYQGWSPLHFASAYGDLCRLKQLLGDGADPNYMTPGKTPLHCACETGNLQIIEALIEGGADPNALTFDPEREGMCPLYIAYIFGHKHILKRLMQLGAKMNKQITELHLAVLFSELDNVDAILKRETTDVNVRDYDEKTPLHVAAKHGLFSVASKLLQPDACAVNVFDRGGRTPLDFVVEHRIKQIFKTDVEENEKPPPPVETRPRSLIGTPKKSNILSSNPPLVDNHQITPPYKTYLDKESKDVIMCMSNGYMSFIKLMLEKADIKRERDTRGYSLLHRAADASDFSLAKLLVGHDRSCIDDITTIEGKTALHFACDRGSERLVKFLLDSGASVNVLTDRDVTPLHLAIRGKHRDIVKKLLMKGAETDVIDSYRGHTPIHSAVINNANDVVELLLAHGANIDIRERWNKYTILHLAWKSDNMAQIDNLLENHLTIMDAADVNGLTTFLTIVYDFVQAEPSSPRTYNKAKYAAPLMSLANHGCLLSSSLLAVYQKNPTIHVTDLIFDVYCKENRDKIGHHLTILLLGIACGTYDTIDKKLIQELCYCRHIDMLRHVRVCGFRSFKRKELRNIKDAGLVEIVDAEVLNLKDMCRLTVRRLLLAVQNVDLGKSENGTRGPFHRLLQKFPHFLKRRTPERSLQLWRIQALPVPSTVKRFLSFSMYPEQ